MRTEPGSVRARVRPVAPSPAAVLRSLLVSAAVFTAAMLTGALLVAAAPAGSSGSDRAPPTAPPAATTGTAGTTEGTAADPHRVDPALARSMVYTGTAALVVSVVGLVMVGRRRRLW